MPNTKPSISLFCILAQNAPLGVIFRRGPSNQVALIKWNLIKDTFEIGQWFKGRIYERRCDLSPNGTHLIYFAANWKVRSGLSWTAVSKPPYLTAMARWPKGDAWGGGGLFAAENHILLNHFEGDMQPESGAMLGKHVRITPLHERSGGGEDFPIYHERLLRDGWVLTQVGESSAYNRKGNIKWEYHKPLVYELQYQNRNANWILQMQLKGIGVQNKAWYKFDYEVLSADRQSLLKLQDTSWAQWDSNGDLLFAEQGKLFRLPSPHKNQGFLRENAIELSDFSDLSFREIKAPKEALQW